MKMILEVCANSYQSALNAQEAGAARIELCSELAIGGITPSYGLLRRVMDNLKIPVFVLIRPRGGNFTYSNDEFQQMKLDIELCKKLGCSGIVSGILNNENSIDVERTKELVTLSKPLAFTFHRAFDWVPNPDKALEQLITLGVDRVLTSGQQKSAERGINLLKDFREKYQNKITILPGGGINADNVMQFKSFGFKEVHASATSFANVNEAPKISMNSNKFFSETKLAFSDKEKISAILKKIEN